MDTRLMAWGALALYAAVTAYLAYLGWRRTSDVASFATGSRTISPVVVGLSLAAQLTSVATFVINPGLMFASGLAGLLGYGAAAGLGIILGLSFFSAAFRRIGARVTALSVPQWLGARYQSQALAVGAALLSLALLSFVVLIVVAIALSLQRLLGVEPTWIAAGLIVFVFSYVLLGGVNTSSYTNAIQAGIMLLVAVLLLSVALPQAVAGPGLLARLAALDPQLVAPVNPSSLYFRTWFEVLACNFVVGLALVVQPHVLAKSLLIKSEPGLRVYLGVAIGAGLVFLSILVVGLVARLQLPAETRLDLVVPTFIAHNFSDGLQVLIMIGILCAGISTLEGMLLALATIISSDLFMPLVGRRLLAAKDEATRGRVALLVTRASIVAFGVLTWFVAAWQIRNPTGGSVTIFAQYGVYILTGATFVPLLAGMFLKQASRAAVGAAAGVAVLVYLLFAIGRFSPLANNPAVLATYAILASLVTFGLASGLQRLLALRRR